MLRIGICLFFVLSIGCQTSREKIQRELGERWQPSQEQVESSPQEKTPAKSVGLVHYIQDEAPESDDSVAEDSESNSEVSDDSDDSESGSDDFIVRSAEIVIPKEVTIYGDPLSLREVLNSVANCYPELSIGLGEIETATGKALAAEGAFDQRLSAHSIAQPLGFYQTYRNGVGIAQPLVSGGEVYGAYRIGDGNFEPWFGERETNEGGELKFGMSIPLLKDRLIDARRAGLSMAELQRDQVQANVESRLLRFERMASQAYWDWVASGQAVEIQRRLLKLAELRVDQIETRVEEGDLAEIAQIDNNRFIAKRQNTLIKARRSLEKSAIKLSIFLRDDLCNPQIVDSRRLPNDFPSSVPISPDQLQTDIAQAFAVRPELAELNASRCEALVDLQYARNLTLPKIDLKGFTGQDLGGAASSKGDKTPFELQVGILAEMPIQRREGFGKIQAAEGKLAQIDAKIQFTSDKIRAALQDAASAVNAAYEQIQQSQRNLELTQKSLELGKIAFDEGDIDLIALNIYETSVADAELQLLEAEYKYNFYKAVYETSFKATGLDSINSAQ